jgi:hypothetical protein
MMQGGTPPATMTPGATMQGTTAVVMPADAVGAPGETAPLMMPQALPHYYGRNESAGYGGCGGCSSCGSGSPGMCAHPRNYHMHLWDNYCYETTRCPACGCCMGSLMHHWKCEREWGCGAAACATSCTSPCAAPCSTPACGLRSLAGIFNPGCGQRGCASLGCASPGCGDRVQEGPATAPAPGQRAVPVPPPPPVTEKKIEKKIDMKTMDMSTPPAGEPKAKQPQDTKEKSGKEPAKTSRVVPEPSSASLLDRLFPWRTSGTR